MFSPFRCIGSSQYKPVFFTFFSRDKKAVHLSRIACTETTVNYFQPHISIFHRNYFDEKNSQFIVENTYYEAHCCQNVYSFLKLILILFCKMVFYYFHFFINFGKLNMNFFFFKSSSFVKTKLVHIFQKFVHIISCKLSPVFRSLNEYYTPDDGHAHCTG